MGSEVLLGTCGKCLPSVSREFHPAYPGFFSMSLKFQLTYVDIGLSVFLPLKEEIGRIQVNAHKYPKSIKVAINSVVGSTWKYPIR